MKEIWKDIPGYEGYQASTLGRIKSLKLGKSLILKQNLNNNGYYSVRPSIKGIPKTICVHQLIAMTFLGYRRPGNQVGLFVDHINGDQLDNKLINLRIISNRENTNLGFDKIKTSSNYRGVSFDNTTRNKSKKWRARIYINGKLKSLGRFDTELEAHEAYQNELKKL